MVLHRGRETKRKKRREIDRERNLWDEKRPERVSMRVQEENKKKKKNKGKRRNKRVYYGKD